MKTSIPRKEQRRGLALLVTVLIIAFAAVFIVSYLVMTQQEYNMVARSQMWNNSLTMAEAGVEEGLGLVNKYAYLGESQSLTNWSATATQDGWSDGGTFTAGTNTLHVFSKSMSLPGNSGSFTVTVTNVTYSQNSPGTNIYSNPVILSVGTVTNGLGASISRSVLVYTKGIALAGQGGVIAWNGVSDSGTTTIDSWDSSTNIHSLWQSNSLFRANYFSPGIAYGIWTNTLSLVSNSYPSRTAAVYVFTDTNTLGMNGNTTIAGFVQTGPNGTVSTSGANVTVGDLAWCYGATGAGNGSSGIEPGHLLQNANLNFHSYALPNPVDSANGWMNWSNIPAPGLNSVIQVGGIWSLVGSTWTNVGGTFYTNTTGNGFTIGGVTYPLVITNRLQNTNWVYYAANQLGSQNIFVDAQYVILYLTNGLSASGQFNLTINTNADLQIFSTGDVSATGQAVINNMGNYTHAFSLFDVAGYPINVSLGGSGEATGYYYVPSSSVKLAGGGSSPSDFVGAIVCYSFNIKGHQNVHFDQSLGNSLPPDQFVPSSWTEIAGQ